MLNKKSKRISPDTNEDGYDCVKIPFNKFFILMIISLINNILKVTIQFLYFWGLCM